jgi:hypothetical protein
LGRVTIVGDEESEFVMLTEEEMDEIGAKPQHFLRKSHRHLAQETRAYSLSSAAFPKRNFGT